MEKYENKVINNVWHMKQWLISAGKRLSLSDLDYEALADMDSVCNDAIEYMLSMEPVPPNDFGDFACGNRYTCGNCNHGIFRNDRYCPFCGRKVKWNDSIEDD